MTDPVFRNWSCYCSGGTFTLRPGCRDSLFWYLDFSAGSTEKLSGTSQIYEAVTGYLEQTYSWEDSFM